MDVVIFVFSLENEDSFNAVHKYFAKMSQHRNMQDVPIILVGTKGTDEKKPQLWEKWFNTKTSLDGVSENSPRLIEESRALKLASDLKRCPYYETCSTYGLNVERVFIDGEKLFLCNTINEAILTKTNWPLCEIL